MRYVIIGNSAAGISAAETIRRLDKSGRITVISDEGFPVYSRCLLPHLIAGERSEEELLLRPEDFYEAQGIEALLGRRVVSIEPEAKRIVLADGEELTYDQLLLAVGGSPLIPEIEGIDREGVFGLRTIEDARRIIAASREAERAVVIGGGLIGLRAAFALHKRGLAVTAIEMLPRVLPQQLDGAASRILSQAIVAYGVELILGQTVQEIVGRDGRVEGVLLADGRRVDCRLVVVAVGVRPNIELARAAGSATERGVLVDERMRTSVADIYAAGDVAETFDVVTGERTLSALWPSAVEQGRLAGYNMAGVAREYEGALGLLNAVEFAGIPVISVGVIAPRDDGYEVLATQRGDVYRKLVLRGNRLVGALLLGEIERAGVYTALIRQKADVGKLKDRLGVRWFNYGYLVRPQAPAIDAYTA